MRHRRAAALLDDYLSGALDARAAQAVSRHLAGCAACGREADELRALLVAAAELPADVPPARDLWEGIAARLAPRRAAESVALTRPADAGARLRQGPGRGRPARAPRFRPGSLRSAALAAPAALLLALIVAVVRHPGGEPPLPPFGRDLPATSLLAGEVALIGHNVKIVDLAIEEIDRARAADPEDPDLSRRLAAAHRARAGLLAHEAVLIARM